MKLFLLGIVLILGGCSTSDYQSMIRASISASPTYVLQNFATRKSIQYAINPKKLTRDLNFLSNFVENISKQWGNENILLPQKREYVKYMQNYKSRALIDFDKGYIKVETMSDNVSLKNAIVTTLLLPDDPRGADLFNAKVVKLGATPYLLGEVKDDQNKNIRYSWRANRYANRLIKNSLHVKNLKSSARNSKVLFVQIPMVKDHASVRVAKFKPYVKKYAKIYNISENLVYAIIKTESNFNQFAISKAGAYGLMQIVPKSAGKDAFIYAKNKNHIPSKSYLFNAKNNIELGTAYLGLINDKYLDGINNPISKEYAVISAYNTGSGNVLKVFHSNRNIAKTIINEKSPYDVYQKLQKDLPYNETKRYLKKVLNYKKEFVNL